MRLAGRHRLDSPRRPLRPRHLLVRLRHSVQRRRRRQLLHRVLLLRLVDLDRALLELSRQVTLLNRRRLLEVQRSRILAVRLRRVRLGRLRRRLGLGLERLGKRRERHQPLRLRLDRLRPLERLWLVLVRLDRLSLKSQRPLPRHSDRRVRLGSPRLERLRPVARVRLDKPPPLLLLSLLRLDPHSAAPRRTIRVGYSVPSPLHLARPTHRRSRVRPNEERRFGITC